MYDFTNRPRPSTRSTLRRVEDYLRSRSTEHWAFFAAGFVAAALLT
ncbi:hypothetical protein [Arenibaculum pallidiluteum]|nr:hypothetical protein [Arenibaculum pallidiluteum]